MKIRIFGQTGSGKSTLANLISLKLNIPIFCTDNFVFNSDFSKRRSEASRIKLINNSLGSSWIVEGVHYSSWCKSTYEDADIIIILDYSRLFLSCRVLKRFFKQDSEKQTSFSLAMKMLTFIWTDTLKERKEYYSIAKHSNARLIILKSTDFNSILDTLN